MRKFFTKLRGAIEGWGIAAKALDGSFWNPGSGGSAIKTEDWRTASECWEALSHAQREKVMQDCNPVFACIWAIMTAAQEPKLTLQKEKEDGFEEIKKHPAIDLMNKPNPVHSRNDLIQYITAHLEIRGRANLWKLRNAMGEVREVWPIPPSWVEDVPLKVVDTKSDKRFVDHYKIKIPGGNEFSVKFEDMGVIRYCNPFSLTGTLSPLQAALKDVQLDSKHYDYEVERMSNIKPSVVVRSKDGLGVEQRDHLRAVLMERMGWRYDNKPITLSGEDTAIEILDALEEKDWNAFNSLRETRVCAAFRVPPIVAGLLVGLENSPWSNTGEAKKWFYSSKMVPLLRLVENGLTKVFLDQEGEDEKLSFWFDTSEIRELQEDMDSFVSRKQKAYEGGAITRNEYRKALGEDPDEINGNVYIMGMGLREIPADEKRDLSENGIPLPDEHEEHWDGDEEEYQEDEDDEGKKGLA